MVKKQDEYMENLLQGKRKGFIKRNQQKGTRSIKFVRYTQGRGSLVDQIRFQYHRKYTDLKIRKDHVPLRPVVNSIGSAIQYVARTLKLHIGSTEHYIKDFIDKASRSTGNDLLVSFDVKSLFSYIPIEETLGFMKIRIRGKFGKALSNIYIFLFNGIYFRNLYGTPSPGSCGCVHEVLSGGY